MKVQSGWMPQATVAHDEIIDPIATVLQDQNHDTNPGAANECEFGLPEGIVASDTGRIEYYSQDTGAGMIQVNLSTAGMDFHMPLTSQKGSSCGTPENGSYCRELFMGVSDVYEGREQ